MMDEKEYYMKFPSVLKQALLNGEVCFDDKTQKEYEPFEVYRGVVREKGETLEVKKEDFLSYAELKKKPRGKKKVDIGWYSCSCFTEKKELEEALKLPRANKRIIKGKVKKEYGPQRTNETSKHVDWWLFEDAECQKEFVVI